MVAGLKKDYVLYSSSLPPTSNTFPSSFFNIIAFQHDVLMGKASAMEKFAITVKLTDF